MRSIKMLASLKNVIVCYLSVALLSGCAALTGISPKYPEGWPSISSGSGDECPDLSGRYQNLATYSFLPMAAANSLAFRLGAELKDADRVVLVFSSATLRVEALNSTGVIGEQLLSKEHGDFSCSDGAFVLPIVIDKNADGTGGYRSGSRLYLRRALGGALIGEERTSGIGAIFWLVPVGGWQTFWFQWEAI